MCVYILRIYTPVLVYIFIYNCMHVHTYVHTYNKLATFHAKNVNC